MKATLRHLAWICVLLCGNVSGQTSTYTVKPGDSMSKIARSQGCTVEALAKANGIKLSAVIQAGQTLKLPGKAAKTTASGSHTIQPGDTFSSIAREHGVSVEALLAANPGLNPKSLKPGQKLLLATSKTATTKAEAPRKTEPTPTAGPTETTTVVEQAPNKTPAVSQPEKPNESPSALPPEEKIRTVMVETEITLGEFATQHGTDIQRLNELNGLDLVGSTVLAKGSELYVPAPLQPE